MRPLVLLLMIALLPLRLWAAEGMAVGMAQQQLAAAAGAAADSMHADCPMATGGDRDAEHGPAEGQVSAGHCTTCHLCAAAGCAAVVAIGHGPVPTGPPAMADLARAGLDLAPDLRPPIA